MGHQAGAVDGGEMKVVAVLVMIIVACIGVGLATYALGERRWFSGGFVMAWSRTVLATALMVLAQ